MKVFTVKYEGTTYMTAYLAYQAHSGILKRIFRKFDPKKEKTNMMRRWIYNKDGLLMSKKSGIMIPNTCIIEICRYFKDDHKYLKTMLTQLRDDKAYAAVAKAFSGVSPELRDFLVNELPIRIDKLFDFHLLKV